MTNEITVCRNNLVTICENVLDPSSWQTFECEGDIRPFLQEHFAVWPETARIYLNHVCESGDVTPQTGAAVERLGTLRGHFFVVIYPEDFVVVMVIIAVAIAAVSIALTFLLRPSLNLKNQQQESPNNSLSDRQNRERPNQRIPDIYGILWATPDLIAVPYRIFEGNREIEHCYMCLGRGYYDISKIRDDTTEIQQIDGTSVEVYAPFTSPNSGDAPQMRIGKPIDTKIVNVKRSNAVNGQILRAPNASTLKGNKSINFLYPDAIGCNSELDFTDFFAPGDTLTIANSLASDPAENVHSVSLDGTYLILDVTSREIVLSNPSAVNGNWNTLDSFATNMSTFGSPTLSTSSNRWVGPFIVDDPNVSEIWCNFVCPQGAYQLDKNGNQYAMNVQIQFGIQAIDASGNPVGAEIFYMGWIAGSSETRSQRAVTIKAILPLPGPCQIRARRYSNTNLDDGWNVSDQAQWRDMYAVTPVTQTHFGNVTTVQAVTWPTQDAMTIKNRKLNMLVGRKINPITVTEIPAESTLCLMALCGAFADVAGHVIKPVGIGMEATLVVPEGATRLQLGINDDTYQDDAGSFNVRVTRGSDVWEGAVNAKTAPWSFTGGINAAYDFGNHSGSGLAPVVVPLALMAGEMVVVTYLSGTVKTAYDDYVTAAGEADIITGSSNGSSGYAFPTKYMEGSVAGDPVLGDDLAASSNIADIICAMALDPYIGNRTAAEINVEEIYAIAGPGGAIETYFGTSLCTQFCFTFDDAKVSFEEMVADVAAAGFCTAYRRGSVLSLWFEKKTSNSTILYNHRNKLPRSETRTFTFGTLNGNDGIELTYVDPNAPNGPENDTPATLYFPADKSATNAKKITLVGVHNNIQAFLIGARIYNKMLYQNTAVQFQATQEAAYNILSQRILVADNTRPETQDGEVKAQNVLELTLSQPVRFVEGRNYTIFLQLSDGTVESIAIAPGSDECKIILALPPSKPLVVDQENFALTTYIIVDDSPVRSAAFLLTEKTPHEHAIYELKSVNYDDRYYGNDRDFIDGKIALNSHGGGNNAGYDALNVQQVIVDGRCMPWRSSINPTYAYGRDDGRDPVVIKLTGTVVVIACEPMYMLEGWNAAINGVRAYKLFPWVDADGGAPVGHGVDEFGGNPTNYIDELFGECGLFGAFCHDDGTVVQPVAIGMNKTLAVPAGATTLQLGINDSMYSDNEGAFTVNVTQAGTVSEPPVVPPTPPPDDTIVYIVTANGE